MTAATHTIVATETGFGIKRIASGVVYGSFESWAEAMMALTEMGIANQVAVADPSNY